MNPNAAYLFSEPDYGALCIPYDDTLDVTVDGCHIYGEIYVPGMIYKAPHPCIILVHGFPGICSSDDLAQSLRRAGFVVIRFNHRGAWNSEGNYSFTNCIEDAITVATYVHDEIAKKYGIDPNRIILAGHSMGGNTVLNATLHLPFLLGTIMMAPYDLSVPFQSGDIDSFIAMIRSTDGKLLKLHTEEEQNRIIRNAQDNYKKTAFLHAVPQMQNRNLLLLGGTKDHIAPVENMIEPLFTALRRHPSTANRKKIYYPTNHDFSNVRLQLAKDICDWALEISYCTESISPIKNAV